MLKTAITLDLLKLDTPELLLLTALRTENSQSASRRSVIPSAIDRGQAFNACSCPKNIGNLRQL